MRRMLRASLLLLAATLVACSSTAPGATRALGQTPSPVATAGATRPVASTDPGVTDDVPSRVVVSSLHIDLPVVSGDLTVSGNPADYPLCDVAQYLTTFRFPGHPGTTTWIYGHARDGMFRPILDASTKNDGASLIGAEVDVYSTGLRRYTYRISAVHRHAVDRSIGATVPPGQGRLVLQTSEGPHGTVPKLQVSADLVATSPASRHDAMPPAAPRGCAL